MPAANFANLSKTAPAPSTNIHVGGSTTVYTCHMAGMHWAFMDLGDTSATANARIDAIVQNKCQGCVAGHHIHLSIMHGWYGANFCAGAVQINSRDALYNAVNVGDVLVTDNYQSPAHTMVVVSKNTMMTRKFVYVRGFNNFGTLGTGTHLAYDASDRDIDRDKYWNGANFGNAAKVPLHRVPYANYSAAAGVVWANCNNAGGPWVYVGP
jgi:hypothetical protein